MTPIHQRIKKYRNPNQWKVAMDVSLIWFQAIIPISIYCCFESNIILPLVLILVGSAQHGLTLVTHEGAHNNLSKTRLLNDFLARWFFAAPVLLPYSIYRKRHFQHHGYLATDEDTKVLYKRSIKGWSSIIELLKSLTAYDFITQVMLVLKPIFVRKQFGATKTVGLSEVAYDFFSLLTAQIVIFILFCLVDPKMYILLWVLPLVTVQMLFGKIRSIVEHRPFCEDVVNGKMTPYYMNTTRPINRTINPTIIERLLITKLNFSYHGEHHLYPSVSYQFLPDVRDEIRRSGEVFDEGYRQETSYFKVLLRMI